MGQKFTGASGILDGNTGEQVDIQHPFSVDGDSVYEKDVWVAESTATNWTDEDGADIPIVLIPFTNLHTRIQNVTTDNPKVLLIHFNRTVGFDQVGLGCSGPGDFSNIKVTVIGSGDVERTVQDDSADNSKYTSRNVQFAPSLGNAVKIEFYTTDPVCLSNITIQKTIKVASRLQAIKPDGSVTDIGATDSGNLRTTDAESGLAIAKGDVIGTSFTHKFGNAPDFDATDGEITVWDGAEDGTAWELMNYVYSATADIDSVSSSDNGDIINVTIEGLDTDWNIISQVVTLTGQTRAAIPTPLRRIFRAYNSNGAPFIGHIIVYVNGATTGGVPNTKADIRAIVDPVNQQTEMAIYTIPAGYTGYMRDWFASIAGANKSSNYPIRLASREFGKVFRTKHTSALSDSGTSAYQHEYIEPEIFSEKTDIEMRCSAAATGVTEASFSAGFDIVLVQN